MKLTREAQLELVTKARGGDASAFGEIYTIYLPYVRGAVRRMIAPDDLEDVVQGVFTHLFERLHKFSGDSDFSTWLFRVARNYALMHKRSQRPTVSFDDVVVTPEGTTAAVPEPSYEDPDIEEVLNRKKLQAAIDSLKPREALFIRLQLAGYANKEIAAITNSTVSTVKSELFRGKQRLAELMGTKRKHRSKQGITRKAVELKPAVIREEVLVDPEGFYEELELVS